MRSVTPKIPCPHCGGYYSAVIDVRPAAAGVFRRRECAACHRRYNTEETYRPYVRRAAHPPTSTQ